MGPSQFSPTGPEVDISIYKKKKYPLVTAKSHLCTALIPLFPRWNFSTDLPRQPTSGYIYFTCETEVSLFADVVQFTIPRCKNV
jgi:hypothetical protein